MKVYESAYLFIFVVVYIKHRQTSSLKEELTRKIDRKLLFFVLKT